MSESRRPNVLMIMADQLAASCLGAYGHPLVRTPNLDRLARRGVVFESAYCNSPICAPSRASLCTGRYVSEIGAYDNGADFPAGIPTFMHHLGRAGYEVWLSGKMHFIGPDQMRGFHRRLTPEIYPSGFTWTPDWNESPCPNPGTAVDQLRTAGLCDWNLQLDYDEEVKFRALEALRDLARRRPAAEDDEATRRPFFLCASFTHPHEPFITTPEWWDLYDPDAVDPPATPGTDIGEMHPYDQWLQIHHMINVYPPGEADVRDARHAYYGMVSYFDHCAGSLIDELERLGLGDDTVILVTSDHGEMLGQHGMWFKRTYFEESARVPLIAAGPGIGKGRRIGETVSLIDLFPTFCELADVPDREATESSIPGDSLCALWSKTGDAGWKDQAIGEYLSEGVCEPMRMIVRGHGRDRLKYVNVRGHRELLFDLNDDPRERVNRIDSPEYAGRLGALRETLLDGWDSDRIRDQVLDSQQRRRTIHQRGADRGWDVQPSFDARHQYVREKNAQETNIERRFPRVD